MKLIYSLFILFSLTLAVLLVGCGGGISNVDWGDAPSPYPTLSANNGASHTIVDKFHLGNLIDGESNGQPNATATGDDASFLADEDGVTFSPLVPGQTAYVTVTASLNGRLDAWMDFNNDGSWATPASEKVFNSYPLAAGPNLLTFTVPANAVPGGFARFRLSTAGGLNFTGPAHDGEVEDYKLNILSSLTRIDWGDAPDGAYPNMNASYPTLASSNGACHLTTAKLFLGTQYDYELNGQPSILANGDDIANLDDEDGVTFNSALIRGQTATITVVTVGIGKLDAWMDFNHNGTWADVGDQIFTSVPLTAGSHTLTFPVPASALVGGTYLRFRLSSAGALSYTGLAADGEVEDYRVGIE